MDIDEREVAIPLDDAILRGDLACPDRPAGIVVFAHGSGSGRLSPRNRFVAAQLHEAGFATLLFDLLSVEEEASERHTRHLRFDIDLLTRRLLGATRWLEDETPMGGLPIGYFGASTGAAAALAAAARHPVAAVVSRGGRPDLAGEALERVTAPTLLIVGGDDLPVIDLNRQALARLAATARIDIIPGAGHLFEEGDTLLQAARHAADWFRMYLSDPQPAAWTNRTYPTGVRQVFRDRQHAGRELARALADYAGRDDVRVLGLPRGGVPVAYEVATALGAPLDVFVVRKLGVPGHEELAMGAIASGDVCVLSDDTLRILGIGRASIDRVIDRETAELHRREREYRGGRDMQDVAGRVVIVVDDGLATGSTMLAALRALRKLGPARLVAAAPVAAPSTCEALRNEADDVVCATTPEPFLGVGRWYEDFSQTTDAEVRRLLAGPPATPGVGAGRGQAPPPPARA